MMILKNSNCKIVVIVGILLMTLGIYGCSNKDKFINQSFIIEQHNKPFAKIVFNSDNIAKVTNDVTESQQSVPFFINKIGSKRYLFIKKVSADVLSAKQSIWHTLKLKSGKDIYYIYLIENLDDEVFHLSAMSGTTRDYLTQQQDVAEASKSTQQNDRLTLRLSAQK
ncbi:DUF4909 domain-containing protein [Staphylococcus simiae]|uniref:DUF4909 domain-containing protein n=2 Tax=Staphylococcus simiae TaxID=308354 RepID=UPI001A992008|nr:DUF4909 domain-containing protein [Staphylococcus simiae]MBO1199207.1 DUF4909 domain-containing protein [Staphylococcus simiae]MBO1203556.1 DUF4909 domain-containing protein [Staphylococcus simiae]MBO1229746.1 DUF4909 domain-containing protein [Staphylococcus simiae]